MPSDAGTSGVTSTAGGMAGLRLAPAIAPQGLETLAAAPAAGAPPSPMDIANAAVATSASAATAAPAPAASIDLASASFAAPASPMDIANAAVTEAALDGGALLALGPGDSVFVQVYGRPEMDITTYVTDAGTIRVPLAGVVQVGGLTPGQAADRVADALRGDYIVDPQVTVTVSEGRSQQVSVLGEVKTPGRYPVESRITVLDLLALAGGVTENGGGTVYVMRRRADGSVQRLPVDLRGMYGADGIMPALAVRGGDSVLVPPADHFYVYGEVDEPDMYRLEPGMTVIQAITRSGGITARGSESRIEIRRTAADGSTKTLRASAGDIVQANDVIRVKERIF